MKAKSLTYSKLYNKSISFFELISDKQQIKSIIEEIKADKAINTEIERFIYQTNFYPELEAKLKSQRAELAKIDDYVKRLELNERIQETENEIKTYKIGILETSSVLYDLKEESLGEVKHAFFAGNLSNANSLLNSIDLGQAQSLLLQKLETEQKLEEVYEKLIANAQEYLVKAQFTSSNLEIEDTEDRTQKAIEFFEKGKIYAEKSRNQEFIADYHFIYEQFLQKRLESLYEKYQNLANEYLVKAQLTSLSLEIAVPEERLEKTIEFFEKGKTLAEKSKKEPFIGEYFFMYGLFLQKNNLFNEAEKIYLQSLMVYRSLAENTSLIYLSDVATVLNNLAILHSATNTIPQAEAEYQEALIIRRLLAESKPSFYLADVATTLNNLGNLHRTTNELAKSEEEYQEALSIRRSLAETDPSIHLPDVALTLNNLAALFFDKNELVKSEEVYKESVDINRTLAKVNPSLYLHAVALTLNNLGFLYYTTNQLDKSEELYQEALLIKRFLAEENPFIHLPSVAAILNNFGILHSNRNELIQSENAYQEALRIRRHLAENNTSVYLSDVADTLNNLAILHRTKNEFAQAESEYQEALEIRKSLAKVNPTTFLPHVATTLNNLANLHRAKNELNQSETEFQQAIEIYKSLRELNPSVYLPALAGTLINCATFYLESKPNRAISIAYIKEALIILDSFTEIAPYTQKYNEAAIGVLEQWEVSKKDLFIN